MFTITTLGDRRENFAMDSELAHWAISNSRGETSVEWALLVMFGIIDDESHYAEGTYEAQEALKILRNTLDADIEVEEVALAGAATKTSFSFSLAA